MPAIFNKKDTVIWKWLGREIEGEVVEIYTQTVVQTIKGKSIKRNGSPNNPAYLVKSTAGNLALKLRTELSKPKSLTETLSSQKKPKLFQ